MTRLHVNVDHVATVRQARGAGYPDPVTAASLAELAGAHGITVHLREDRRHIQDRDVEILRKTVTTVLNLEMAFTEEIMAIARDLGPDIVTIVPEKRQEQTTERGLILDDTHGEVTAEKIASMREAGIRVSLFINAEEDIIRAAADMGAQMVELHTGPYCHARGEEKRRELEVIERGAALAHDLGLAVAAGHGLSTVDVGPIAAIDVVEELNIGHSIVARAVLIGMERAVREMLEAMHPQGLTHDPEPR
jgi:pyridoxine 5-phosphate synthase